MAQRRKVKPYDENDVPDMRFLIKSTGCQIMLTKIIKQVDGIAVKNDIYVFAYLNRTSNLANNYEDKPPFNTYIEQVERQVNFNTWVRL